MEAALNNHLILETIAKFAPFHDLKNMRLVTSDWAKATNPILRKRSVSKILKISDQLTTLLQEEKDFSNADLVARVPLNVLIDFIEIEVGQLQLFTEALRHIPDWFQRVQDLTLELSAADLNRILKYLLHTMPVVDKLEIDLFPYPWSSLSSARLPDDFQVPSVPPHDHLRLKTFAIHCGGEEDDNHLSLDFLLRCPNLKCFEAYIYGNSPRFLEFLDDWQNLKRPSRFEKIELTYLCFNDVAFFWQALVNFINLNKPSKLRVDSPAVSSTWTSALRAGLEGTSLRHLDLTVPVYFEDVRYELRHSRVNYAEIVLLNARRFPGFSEVTHFALKFTHQRFEPHRDLVESSLEPVHNFEFVISLTIELCVNEAISFDFPESHHLPNVVKLTIKQTSVEDSTPFLAVLKSLSGFAKLQELELDMYRLNCSKVTNNGDHGMFANPHVGPWIELRKLKVIIRLENDDSSEDDLLAQLFAGYRSNVPLDFLYWSQDRSTFREFRYTVEQFQARMNEIEAALPPKSKRLRME